MAAVSRELVDRLYTAPPDGFVAARAEAVAAARAAGDTAAAREIGRLRKPTVAAWLVNLLALRRPQLVADLVDLSAALRSAQRELAGPRLRELSGQRRGAVNALVAEVRALAREADPALSAGKLPLAEVEATLNAALSDETVAEQVRTGRLLRATSYAGFGEVPRPQLRLVTGGAGELDEAAVRPAGSGRDPGVPGRPRPAGSPPAERADSAAALRVRRRALRRELDGARDRQAQAEAELTESVAAERDGADALAGIEAELAALERARAAAEAELSRRRLARKAAERSVVAARRHVGEAQAAAEALPDDDQTP
ncbi:hypothetical protein O7627_29140 [Solwaraspora sp. WMMD1047]|uniref:hypothetical protein n=1 Tax=Solwaraspora sp. WMMD1047 TaxID=3016102 RepID=UPI0024175848|nr:hypothetical protein [Solwaraspora sp. WMMD1047]MDG4833341.1 hypothetical protein [Solwaraspora sp. WMMD1047]